MQRRSRIRTFLLAVSVAVLAGAAWCQPLPVEWTPQRVAQLYGHFVAQWTERGDLGEAIVGAAREGAGLDGQDGRTMVCASLPGTGGNARVDGGGNPRMDGGHGAFPGDWGGTLLAPFPSVNPILWPYDATGGHDVAFPLNAAVARPQVRMAVIDAFDLGVLAAIGNGAVLDGDGLWQLLIASQFGRRVEASPVAHGNLVLFHLLSLWAHPGGLYMSFRDDGDPNVLRVRAGTWEEGQEIELHLLEITYGDVNTIKGAMDAARTMNGVVVVASWGLVDCTLAAGYHAQAEEARASASAPATFAEYVAAALERSGRAADLLELLCDAFDVQINEVVGAVPCNDLSNRDLLTVAALAQMDVWARSEFRWEDLGETVVFASAGNQGLPFPMPPAAWPGVVAVEACMATDPGRLAAFSNEGTTGHFGEVSARALGAWFSTPAVGSDSVPLGYWGTSFAAPAAAAAYSAAGGWTGIGPQFVAPCVQGQR